MMIWDEIDRIPCESDQYLRMAVRNQPDIVCFNYGEEKTLTWLGANKNLLPE